MHQLATSPALLSIRTSLLHSNRVNDSRSNKAYNTKSYLLLTISSINLNQIIYVILSISKILVKLASPTTYISSFHPLTSKHKFSDRSIRKSSLCLWNSLPVNLRSFSNFHLYLQQPSCLNKLFRSRNQFLSGLTTYLFSFS